MSPSATDVGGGGPWERQQGGGCGEFVRHELHGECHPEAERWGCLFLTPLVSESGRS